MDNDMDDKQWQNMQEDKKIPMEVVDLSKTTNNQKTMNTQGDD